MILRRYAQIVGIVLILVGILGFLLGARGHFLGILNKDLTEEIVHLVTGGLLAYVGFGRLELGAARSVVGALGVFYLQLGILGFILPTMFGLIPSGYTVFDDILHLALRVLSLVIAYAPGGITAMEG
jgi:Domain of unknown function (DUF4383)